MSPETLFLQPLPLPSSFVPNWGDAKAVAQFSNYSHTPLAVATDANILAIVQGGAGSALGAARSFFQNDPTFNVLFASSLGVADEGAYQINSQSEAKAIASFTVGAGQNFSFQFSTNTISRGKEIENTKSETSQIFSRSAFLVVETGQNGQTKVIDFFGISGYLDAVKKDELKFGASQQITFSSRSKRININGNNGEDFLIGAASGTYQKVFRQESKITILELTTTTVALRGDTLIGSLEPGVTYGSIWNDHLKGTSGADKIYASLGDDVLDGRAGDDSLEGGQGNDRLDGGTGRDKLHGGAGDDWLVGGAGEDWLAGGTGSDRFVFQRGDLQAGQVDRIEDFQVTIDQVLLRGMGIADVQQWWGQVLAGGLLTDTTGGALLTIRGGSKVLFNGVAAGSLSASDFVTG